MTSEHADPWGWVHPDDEEAVRASMLDARDLSPEFADQLRKEAADATARSIVQFIGAFGRDPSDAEIDILSQAVIQHLNAYRVPELRQRAAGLH